MDWGTKWTEGLPYSDFLDRHGDPEQQRRWQACHDLVVLTTAQRDVLAGFQRQIKVLVLAGTWCGDCVNQCPIFDHFARGTQTIELRFFDRDEHHDLADELTTCGGQRVPAVAFVSEDDHLCGRYGDRTLSKYRALAAQQLGPACPTGLVTSEQGLLPSVVQEWLDEFERMQLMLRMSGRLRALHGD
jgi:hypothetical protein